MRSIFHIVLYWVRWLFGVVPRSFRGSRTLYLVAHYTLVVVITLLLAYFSNRIKDPAEIALPFEFVRRFWFGILFLLGYLFVRLVIYLIGLLTTYEEPEFGDIERAWRVGMEGLAREGLDIRWLPTFLVNGLTVDQERQLFQGSHLNWKVVAPPLDDRGAVLRLYANEDAVFISCTGVGAMSRQMEKVTSVGAGMARPALASSGGGSGVVGTLRREDIQQASVTAAAGGTLRSVAAVAAQQTMLPPAQRAAGGAGPAEAGPAAIVAQPLDAGERAHCRRRVEYLCYLISRDREPYCAINGLLQTSPVSWSANQHEQAKVCPSTAADLESVSRSLALNFPVVLLITGLEQLDGFGQFIERCGKMDPRFLDSRAGSRFPAGSPIDSEHARWAVERSLQWFRGWIYSSFAQDLSHAGNRRLYQMLCDLSDRRNRLEFQIKRTFEFRTRPDEPMRLSGCYFAGTGDGSSRQAFIKGVLLKLIGEQNDVAWSRRLLGRDRLARLWAWLLFLAAAGFAIADGYLVWLIMRRVEG